MAFDLCSTEPGKTRFGGGESMKSPGVALSIFGALLLPGGLLNCYPMVALEGSLLLEMSHF